MLTRWPVACQGLCGNQIVASRLQLDGVALWSIPLVSATTAAFFAEKGFAPDTLVDLHTGREA